MELIDFIVVLMIGINVLYFVSILFLLAKVYVLGGIVQELLHKKQEPQQPPIGLGYTPIQKPIGPMAPKDKPPGIG